jgi:hypothetical protein
LRQLGNHRAQCRIGGCHRLLHGINVLHELIVSPESSVIDHIRRRRRGVVGWEVHSQSGSELLDCGLLLIL